MSTPDSIYYPRHAAAVSEAMRTEFRGALAVSLAAPGPDVEAPFGLLSDLAGRLGDNVTEDRLRRLWRIAGAFFEGLAMKDLAPDRESRLLSGQLGLALETPSATEGAGAEESGASADRLARRLLLRIARAADPASPRMRALGLEFELDRWMGRGPPQGEFRVSGANVGEDEHPEAEAARLLDAIGEDLRRWRVSGVGSPPLDSLRLSFNALGEWAASHGREQISGLGRSVGRLLSLSKGKKGATLDGMPDLLEEVRDGLQAELNAEPAGRADLVESLNTLVSLLLPDHQPQSLETKDEA